MNLTTKQTDKLAKSEIMQICNLFEDVFKKKISSKDFINKFSNNIKNYSYHSFLLNDNDEIVGCYSVIPYEYNYFGKKVLFGLSVDTMIKEEYRGSPFTLKKLANEVYLEMKKDGVSFVFGFPNDNVYLVRKKILKWKDIGKLKYYILPINIGVIKNKFQYFNLLSRVYARVVNKLVISELNIMNQNNKPIEKISDENHIQNRYNDSYNIEIRDTGFFVYKIYVEDDVRTAFIIDVYPLTKAAIEFSTKSIYEKEQDNIDVILYIGQLDFNLKNLIEVPSKYEPKIVHMSGKILDETKVDDKVYNINNWNVNLSNYDVR